MWAKIQKTRQASASGHSNAESSRQPVLQTTSGNFLPPKDVLKELPALPSHSPETSSHGNLPTSPIRDYARYADDISPPVSPVETSPSERNSDVSPIEGGHFFAEVPKSKQSHLPVPQHRLLPDNQGLEASRLFNAGRGKLQMFSKPRDQKSKQQQAREPWKGASGRFPLVPPIETKSTKPSKQHRPSAQRDTEPDPQSYFGHGAYTTTTITAGNPMGEKLRPKRSQFRLRSRNASPAGNHSPREPRQNTSLAPEENVTSQNVVHFSAEVELPTPTLETSEELNVSDMLYGLTVAQEPRSRFSASTYAPTIATTTPPGSSHAEEPPVPSIEQGPSIMTRRRPIPSSAASIKSVKRKPVSSETSTQPEADVENLSPEQQTLRRADGLETRRKQLSLRKDSIRTMLYELTEVIQPSSIAYDMATRDEVKKTVNSLKTELDDIGKEDHEIGLKLVRLYKNLNRDTEFGDSALWVKRITS